jgi:hypothetical protein
MDRHTWFLIFCTLLIRGGCFTTSRQRSRLDRIVKISLKQRASAEEQANREDAKMHSLISCSRRHLFHETTTAALSVAFLGNPSAANAAAPITVEEAENFGAKAQRLLRPKPPKALRPKLNKDFAVLLMRSSYNALDKLDCVAMVRILKICALLSVRKPHFLAHSLNPFLVFSNENLCVNPICCPKDQFQRDFFIIRQAEYEPYVKDLGPGIVQQGDLTDPFYFDFISFAQYAAINREISQDPPAVFTEKQPVDVGENEPQQFTSVVIRRDPSLTNDKLAPTHSRLVASAVLDKIEEIFGETDARLPKVALNSRPDPGSTRPLKTCLDLLFSYAFKNLTFFLSFLADKSYSYGLGFPGPVDKTIPHKRLCVGWYSPHFERRIQ